MSREPILVTGAAGRLGGVWGAVVEILRKRDWPVRALVRTDFHLKPAGPAPAEEHHPAIRQRA